MLDDDPHVTDSGTIALLLHPSAVPVLDIFRSRREIAETQDMALVEDAEAELRLWTSPGLARSVVSEATLLAFSLARERSRPMDFRSSGSRLTTSDERDLMVLVLIAGGEGGDELKAAAAGALGVPIVGLTSAAAADLALAINESGLQWPAFRLVYAQQRAGEATSIPGPVPSMDDAAFKFKI